MKKPLSDRYGYIPGGHPCPTCGKRSWLTRADAKKVARRMHDTHLNVYRCGDAWHLGHLPAPVIRGDLNRSDITPPHRQEAS